MCWTLIQNRYIKNCSATKIVCLGIAMGSKRDRVEIMAEILCLCSKPQSKTRIMYGTNLSWKMLQHYLAYMQEHELLKNKDESTKYITTTKGREFVSKWKELQELFETPLMPKNGT